MRPLFVISDVHIGAQRSAGTTPASALLLRRGLLFGFQQLLERANGCDLLINGDLFDATNIALMDLYAAMHIAGDWLARNPEGTIYLPPGNHDLSKNSETFSSFDFFANYLRTEYGARVVVPREACKMFDRSAWIVPHMPNQDLFDLELKKIPPCDYLFLHCNFDNKFAAQADHSLNLSPEMAQMLLAKWIVIGHEHQAKTALDGKVRIIGNQIPSSVADCLGNATKWALKILSDNHHWIETWYAEESFAQVDWKDLREIDNSPTEFIRVTGDATAAEASAVVTAIAKFRQKSSSLVITNAVLIDGHDASEMEVSLEQIQAFDVMTELLGFLNDRERAVVTRLLEKAP